MYKGRFGNKCLHVFQRNSPTYLWGRNVILFLTQSHTYTLLSYQFHTYTHTQDTFISREIASTRTTGQMKLETHKSASKPSLTLNLSILKESVEIDFVRFLSGMNSATEVGLKGIYSLLIYRTWHLAKVPKAQHLIRTLFLLHSFWFNTSDIHEAIAAEESFGPTTEIHSVGFSTLPNAYTDKLRLIKVSALSSLKSSYLTSWRRRFRETSVGIDVLKYLSV